VSTFDLPLLNAAVAGIGLMLRSVEMVVIILFGLTLIAVLAFVVAGGCAVAVSWTAAEVIERRSAKAVNWVLAQDGITWANSYLS
jgi:hypothetical protein